MYNETKKELDPDGIRTHNHGDTSSKTYDTMILGQGYDNPAPVILA